MFSLDHRMGSLYNNLRIKHNGELVDVQLIISAGMSIERGINPVRPGGVVYLTDGGASSAACLRTDNGESKLLSYLASLLLLLCLFQYILLLHHRRI
jgi:hypothetical protein